MKILITAFLAFFNFGHINNYHESVKATFNVIEKGHVIMLEVEFDTDDYLKINKLTKGEISKENFAEYLHKTTRWEFDDENLIPDVLSLESIGHHTKAVCLLSRSRTDIKSIKIKNEFLLGVHSHSNIIMLDVNKTFKDFRMHKKRTTLSVDYN